MKDKILVENFNSKRFIKALAFKGKKTNHILGK